MDKKTLSKIIFSNVLEMPLRKYLATIEKTVNELSTPFSTHHNEEKELFYARVMIKDGTLCFKVSDKRLETIYSVDNCTDNKTVCSLKWINTRNRFSLHILKSLFDYQRKYWFSGKKRDIKPLTLRQFLFLYPLQYLEESRLSRLLQNLSVKSPQDQIFNLRSLFISKKKYHSYLIEEMVNNENTLKDKDIQNILTERGIYLSVRTICNCRELLNIPNYKERDIYYYEKDINSSDYIMISKKYLHKIPNEAGVYEISIPLKIDYLNHRSNVIYIGCSKNLRKRIADYSGNNLKNNRLKNFVNNYDVFVRFCLDENYSLREKLFLKKFMNIYGELPKANSVGG